MIYFTTQKRRDLITIDDSFARLVEISPTDDLTFELEYVVAKNSALKAGATLVRTTVSDTYVPESGNIASTTTLGEKNTAQYVKNLLQQMTQLKAIEKARTRAIICKSIIDLTAYVSNDDPSGKNPQQRYVVKTIPASSLKRDNDVRPILVQTAHVDTGDYATAVSSSYTIDRQKIMLSLINDGIDPSIVSEMTHRSVTAHDTTSGLLRKNRVEFAGYAPASQLLNSIIIDDEKKSGQFLTSDVTDSSGVQILDVKNDDSTYMYTTIVIPRVRLKPPNRETVNTLYLEIEFINAKTGVTIEIDRKTIDVGRYVRVNRTPTKAPGAKVVVQSDGGLVLEVNAKDDVTTSYDIYRKSIVPLATYDFLSTQFADISKRTSISIGRPTGVTEIYRVVPVGPTGQRSPEYANVVVNPSIRSVVSSMSVAGMSVATGVRIDVFNIPHDTASVLITVEDLSDSEPLETIVGSAQRVDEEIRKQGTLSIIDPNVVDGHRYRYAAHSIDENGLKRRLSTTFIEHRRPQIGRVDTKITDLSIVSTGVTDVSFNIASIVNDTTLDLVKDVLTRNDTIRYFDNDVQRQREFLKRLLVHGIQRVNLTSGQRDDFGQISGDFFSDAATRDKRAISPPVRGAKYRYEIYVMLRSPETVIEGILKDAVDPATKKPYVYSPGKFLHPVALERGLLTSRPGLSSRFGLDEMLFGSIGMTFELTVSIGSDNIVVTDASVERFDPETLSVTWSIDGTNDIIDHFLIVKEVNRVRTIVGKAHALSNTSTFTFYAKMTERDTGELKYIITPVSNAYETLASVYTNSIVIGET